ncbi:Bifunctional folate synthesis protein [Pedobacter sp. Bi27]|jgi:7,8-dihydroneopterin aldolase/epimerase/oxygenase|uniref:dihydroneopterin aldolase n=1 Tax=unclassified Pedobacter TaxID=2628915 RepID=UPI001D73618A|nr:MULTISPECIES: dihydroneopterin aldolase [unclassified Pedobacter]CAH0149310.1 Bifunctional folate synthesis protein [Pedobacter sp. Bi36]CAH0205356.1 Bifunctional folate synthesis protein [Pedobacter sp. Bi126]CAH0263615.1 Bifunctional folate synthesis protein [Pedobacter sp. Bi27]
MSHFKQTVALKDVKCFALHGYYPEEQLIGNHFVVDLVTEFTPQGFDDELAQTVNYEDLNHIIMEEMKHTQKLLETVLKNIISKVIELYPFVEMVNVSMKKLNPPMPGQIGHSFVKLSYISAK